MFMHGPAISSYLTISGSFCLLGFSFLSKSVSELACLGGSFLFGCFSDVTGATLRITDKKLLSAVLDKFLNFCVPSAELLH